RREVDVAATGALGAPGCRLRGRPPDGGPVLPEATGRHRPPAVRASSQTARAARGAVAAAVGPRPTNGRGRVRCVPSWLRPAPVLTVRARGPLARSGLGPMPGA